MADATVINRLTCHKATGTERCGAIFEVAGVTNEQIAALEARQQEIGHACLTSLIEDKRLVLPEGGEIVNGQGMCLACVTGEKRPRRL